ncbi:hypothetical protein [Streptomyces sp. NPDC051684]|uniref:hypothetical protein n=1 Tax=Streptomyces sp. NPDC051684 TaxID=3365670 RepID=UPI00378A651D
MTRPVFRIEWLPGTDLLDGHCHCGERHTSEDPVAMWEWMLAHPDHPQTPEPKDRTS